MAPRSRSTRPTVDELVVGDPPDAWAALGFRVDEGVAAVGGVRIRLAGRSAGKGLSAWSLRGAASGDLDGLVTQRSDAEPPAPAEHPNGAVAVDHAVVFTPDLERTLAALDGAGLDRRRTRDAGGGVRQAFYVLGPMVLEVAGPVGDDPAAPARFWGIVVVVEDIDALAARLGDRLGSVRDAVQPGRRIATLRPDAGLSVPLAFMTPRH